MVDPYDEIDFLTRSENRIAVLRLLAEHICTEGEIATRTEMSETTVGRVIEAFLDRGWIHETDDGYTTTQFGDLIAEDYRRFSQSIDLARRLGPRRHLLPIEEFDFDIRLLTEAKVTDPERLDTLQSVDRWAELIQESDTIRFVASTGNKLVIRLTRDEVVEHETTHEAVFTPDLFEYITSHPDLSRMHREMIEAGASFYRLPDGTEFPWFLALYDDLLGVGGFDESGTIQTGFETKTSEVVRWGENTFTEYKNDATYLTVEDFAE